MRTLVTLALVSVAIFLAAAPPVSAVTISAWATTPITVGDKVFTLISTTWATDGSVTAATYTENGYVFSLAPGSDKTVTNRTESLLFRVTIIDDPSTPGNEALLNWFSSVSGDGNRYIASGSFTASGAFDDNSDYSSPLATFSNTATPWGPSPIAGTVKQLYVRLTFVASGGSTILSTYSVTFQQMEETVPTEPSTWGKVKALYR